ncbi:hypothetical protein C5167_021342 [Papaver somniferum]|uniref:Uncharacterized protein n=1 Tax=Papaver somniferum TaxID=3469 RepID=A0A4Y7IYU9_PAPSO|nr:hypothetical protein C5167_021342 [Papaver somniferum]
MAMLPKFIGDQVADGQKPGGTEHNHRPMRLSWKVLLMLLGRSSDGSRKSYDGPLDYKSKGSSPRTGTRANIILIGVYLRLNLFQF